MKVKPRSVNMGFKLESKRTSKKKKKQTWPSERKPATSITVVNSLGSNSGLFTPTFPSAIPTPIKSSSIKVNGNENKRTKKNLNTEHIL